MDFNPPLPTSVLDVLASTTLAYLATVEEEEDTSPSPSSPPSPPPSSPHLSLMVYSFVVDARLSPDDSPGLLVMSTRRDSKKFRALIRNPRVALLVHDFDGRRGGGAGAGAGAGAAAPAAPAAPAAAASSTSCHAQSGGGTCSVTVYGDAVVVEGALCERLRAAHLARNPSYAQFIRSDDTIAVIAVSPRRARIANIDDRVSVWEAPRPAAKPATSGGS
jgi:hypothetical protein